MGYSLVSEAVFPLMSGKPPCDPRSGSRKTLGTTTKVSEQQLIAYFTRTTFKFLPYSTNYTFKEPKLISDTSRSLI